jgi:hypothetical protein
MTLGDKQGQSLGAWHVQNAMIFLKPRYGFKVAHFAI